MHACYAVFACIYVPAYQVHINSCSYDRRALCMYTPRWYIQSRELYRKIKYSSVYYLIVVYGSADNTYS